MSPLGQAFVLIDSCPLVRMYKSYAIPFPKTFMRFSACSNGLERLQKLAFRNIPVVLAPNRTEFAGPA